jgi:hypothetical protein
MDDSDWCMTATVQAKSELMAAIGKDISPFERLPSRRKWPWNSSPERGGGARSVTEGSGAADADLDIRVRETRPLRPPGTSPFRGGGNVGS